MTVWRGHGRNEEKLRGLTALCSCDLSDLEAARLVDVQLQPTMLIACVNEGRSEPIDQKGHTICSLSSLIVTAWLFLILKDNCSNIDQESQQVM